MIQHLPHPPLQQCTIYKEPLYLKVCVMFLLQCIINMMSPVLLESENVIQDFICRWEREGSCCV
jgi:hypothetical protein